MLWGPLEVFGAASASRQELPVSGKAGGLVMESLFPGVRPSGFGSWFF